MEIVVLLFIAAALCCFGCYVAYRNGYNKGYLEASKKGFEITYGKEEAEKYFGKKKEEK